MMRSIMIGMSATAIWALSCDNKPTETAKQEVMLPGSSDPASTNEGESNGETGNQGSGQGSDPADIGQGSDQGSNQESDTPSTSTEIIDLPAPELKGTVSLEESLARRESVRQYEADPLTIEEISQLLWSAQGITHDDIKRTSPSAGRRYPMEVYFATKEHFYHYLPEDHQMALIANKDMIAAIDGMAQGFLQEAPAMMVITGVYARTEERYGERAERYVILEAGHVCQNILLQAVTLGLGAVAVGAFKDEEVQ